MFQVYNISKIAASESCAHLYYQKQVYVPGTYLLSSTTLQIQCLFTKPVKMIHGSYDQDSEKLAQTSLIFSDSLSHLQPSQGISVRSCPQNPCGKAPTENLYESIHPLKFPWTMTSGWNLDDSSVGYFIINFGSPPRTVFIWGMQFLKAQFKETLNVVLKNHYSKDVENGAYGSGTWLHPSSLEIARLELDISPGDLDDSGVFRFKDPEDSTKPMMFVASKILVNPTGPKLLNFDFIGTFYDFETAVDGKHANDKNDNWNEPVFGKYFVAGEK